jgi:hypothetical protein
MANANTAADKAASTAKTAADQTAELGKRTSEQAAGMAHEAASVTEDAARRGLQLVHGMTGATSDVQREVARRSAEGTAELGQAVMTLVNEQAQHNFTTWKQLSAAVDWDQVIKAVDWDQVARIQTEFLRVSLERSALLAKRYFEVTQTVMTAAASTVQDKAKKAA